MSWIIDPAHTRAEFAVKHMMVANVRGQFTDITGLVDFNEQDPVKSAVDVKIGVASINTREEKRDEHLKSPDFFDVANHPYMTFKSKRIEKTGDNTGRVIGDLTIRGKSKEVALDVEYNGQAKSPWGTTNAGFTATAKINRKDWDLNWNVALETGGWLVGDTISLNLEAEIVKQAEAAPAAATA
ncbi:MAG: polyisoprenoid-binding protein [Chloroflexi bacterium]|nr:polyisoprenoid-binding protein [Chloroflexota bacterium]